MIGWLRRLICRCPDPEPTIQNTGFTGGSYGSWRPTGGISLDRVAQYHAEGPIAPWPPGLEGVMMKPPRHLHAVPDETER